MGTLIADSFQFSNAIAKFLFSNENWALGYAYAQF